MESRDERIKAIRERCDKATGGEWSFALEYPRTGTGGRSSQAVPKVLCHGRAILEGFIGDNPSAAELAAHSREDIPFLVAEVERLEKENELMDELLCSDEPSPEAIQWGEDNVPH